MEQLPPLGTAVPDIAPQTLKIYEPILVQNATAIKSTLHKSFSYGAHPRQALDVYLPSNTRGTESGPILIFFYGGGLVRGEKALPNYAHGLVHANIGHFFADKLGYTVVIPDYRLSSHGAKFPSGGEDVALVVEWARSNLADSGRSRDLFMMGNSAGGVHLSTFLFSPAFAEARKMVNPDGPAGTLSLRGVVMLSVPFHFREALASRRETLKTYYGDRVDDDSPLGLLKASPPEKDDGPVSGVRVLVLNGSLDPEDEILGPKKDFVEEWATVGSAGMQKALTVAMMDGHNHISPALSLGTDQPHEESWGHQVGSWVESMRTG